jgi:hypothetical protein
MTLALLLTAASGAWAEETPLVTITIGSDGNPVYSAEGLVTLTGTNYNTGSAGLYFWLPSDTKTTLSATVAAAADNVSITKVVFWSSDNNGDYNNPLEDTAAPYLCYANSDDSKRGKSLSDDFATKVDGYRIAKVEVYGTAEITEWSLTPDADKKVWTLDKMPANNIELQVEYEPTKVTLAANDKTMGTVEVGGESKVEWTADTWNGWMSDKKENTVGDITMTSSQNASIYEYTYNTSGGKYLHSLTFFVSEREDNASVTFSTTGDPFSRIEFTMIDDYDPGEGSYHGVPNIQPADGWTFSGKSAVWEGEATKSLTLQSCSTNVSKITFFKGAIPDGVTINGDGTFTVAKTATVTLKATPKEGYKFLYWEDDQTNTNPVREVTIESGMADMTYKAVFAEITYNVTFADGIEDADKWTATPNTEVKKETKVDIKYNGTKKVIGVKVAKDDGSTRLDESTVGMIVCTNGKAYPVNMKDNLPSGVTAVGIVAYKNGKTGLVMALTDEATNMNWGTATGNNGAKAHTPAVEGYSWKVPTIGEWQYNILTDAGVGNLAGLSTYMTAAGGTGLQNGCYWTSTPKNNSYYARCIKIENGSINFSPGGNTELKSNGYLVRAVFAF